MKQLCHYLVVDDDSTSNLICNYTIKRFDEEAVIHLFTSPEEALQFIKDEVCDPEAGGTILFLDINMPTMNGFEFLVEFRKLGEEIKKNYNIYMLTSSIEDFSSQAVEFPMVKAFLSKPLSRAYLQDINREMGR